MKRIFILFSFISCLFFINSANALLPVGMSFGLRGGNSFSSIKNVSTNTSKDSKFFIAPNLGIKLFSLRGEVEYIYRHNFLKINNSSTKAESTMFNLYYNFFDISLLKLYVNGGYGTTKFSYSGEKKNNSTYSAGIGTNISLFDAVNIDFGYKYVDMGKINSTKIDSHDVYLGLRFGF